MGDIPVRFHHSIAFLPTNQVLPLARACDELGYGGIYVSDHIFNPRALASRYTYSVREDGAPGWEPETQWPDPMCLISGLATATEHLAFTTGVYIAPLRDLITVARTVGTAAVLSDNRVRLGVGRGLVQGGVRPDRAGLRLPRPAPERDDRRPARPVARRVGRVPRRLLRRARVPD